MTIRWKIIDSRTLDIKYDTEKNKNEVNGKVFDIDRRVADAKLKRKLHAKFTFNRACAKKIHLRIMNSAAKRKELLQHTMHKRLNPCADFQVSLTFIFFFYKTSQSHV